MQEGNRAERNRRYGMDPAIEMMMERAHNAHLHVVIAPTYIQYVLYSQYAESTGEIKRHSEYSKPPDTRENSHVRCDHLIVR